MRLSAERSTKDRLKDILQAIERITHAEEQLQIFDQGNDLSGTSISLDAIFYNLVVIGEAVNSLPDDLVSAEPEVPWRRIVSMRNYLAHEYFRVITDVVRATIDQPLAQLKAACLRLLDNLNP